MRASGAARRQAVLRRPQGPLTQPLPGVPGRGVRVANQHPPMNRIHPIILSSLFIPAATNSFAGALTLVAPQGQTITQADAKLSDGTSVKPTDVGARATFATPPSGASVTVSAKLSDGTTVQGVDLSWHSEEPADPDVTPLTDDDRESRPSTTAVRSFTWPVTIPGPSRSSNSCATPISTRPVATSSGGSSCTTSSSSTAGGKRSSSRTRSSAANGSNRSPSSTTSRRNSGGPRHWAESRSAMTNRRWFGSTTRRPLQRL
jgi:hypothetical protein